MLEVKLSIQTPQGNLSVVLNEKLSLGRTDQADLALPDASLSRLHATFERHTSNSSDEIWVYDENSMNGTFVNGEPVLANGVKLKNGAEIYLGENTRILIEIQSPKSKVQSSNQKTESPQSKVTSPKSQAPPPALIYIGGATCAILFLAIITVFIVRSFEPVKNAKKSPTQSTDIPFILIDPLKGDPDDLDEIFEAFEVQEDMNAENLDDVKSTDKETVASSDPNNPNASPGESISLNVTRAFWEEQKAKALANRTGETGISPAGLDVPPELRGDGVIKQKQKLAELINVFKYQQPMDFGDLARKRIDKELIELPMATNSFYLEVGSSAIEDDFTAFDFDKGNVPIPSDSPKSAALKTLANNFAGQKYDLNNGRDRKQMRIRLLRMFHPRALPILKELGDAYQKQFNRPLRVTSLTRSMDYQIALNRVNPNSFKVRGAGSLPPHTSGCAFDLGRKHMSVEEQNFVMKKLAEMEKRGVLDALIEYNVNACFHTFIYPDGKPPGK